MNIGILGSDPDSGLLFYPVRLACVLKRMGHSVKVYSWTDRGQTHGLKDMLTDYDIPIIYRMAVEHTGFKGILIGLTSKNRSKMSSENDLLLTHGPMGAFQLRDTVRNKGMSVALIESMGHDGQSYWKPKIGAIVLNSYCAKVGALCHLERARLIRAGVSKEKIVIIHNPLDWRSLLSISKEVQRQDRRSILAQYHLPTDRRFLGCMASFQPRKRQDLLIKAFASLKNEFGQFDLVFCGNGTNLESCKDLATNSGLKNRTHFLGLLSNHDTIQLTTVLDAFAIVSNAETFGYSFVEPLLFEKPTLVSRVGIGWEMEQSGVAVVVAPDNLDETITGLRQILAQDKPILEMMSKGKQFVVDNFDVGKIASQLIALSV